MRTMPVADVYDSITMVNRFFKGDWAKTYLWFHTPNPMFGNIEPWDLVILGKTTKLFKAIHDTLAENKPE